VYGFTKAHHHLHDEVCQSLDRQGRAARAPATPHTTHAAPPKELRLPAGFDGWGADADAGSSDGREQ
jgi:hypothetical protein